MFDHYEKCLGKIIEKYTTGDFYREIYNAKKEFFSDSGILNEDNPEFENQMDLFMGWFLFDRKLAGYDLAPVNLFFRKNKDKFEETEYAAYENLTKSIHSVFEMLKKKDETLVIREFCSRKKFEIYDTRFNLGFSKGDVFEARIVPMEQSYCFARGFCFHPQESVKFIKKQVAKVRNHDSEQRNRLLFQLNQMKLKHQRYPHIQIDFIYSLEPKL